VRRRPESILRSVELRPRRVLLGLWARSNGRSMDDFPNPAFVLGAGLLALLILAIGPALDGASLTEAATVPALMVVWVGALIDRWVMRRR
jgi:hypothetical protein